MPSSCKLFIPTEDTTDWYNNFIGENPIDSEIEISLHCLYKDTFSEKDLQKYGVKIDFDTVLTISSKELAEKIGDRVLSDDIKKSLAGIKIEFRGKKYNIVKIQDYEPFEIDGEIQTLGFDIFLSNNYD